MKDRRTGASRGWTSLRPAGLGVFIVLVAAGLFATVPGTLADIRAYATAPACPGGTQADSCTTAVPATVKATQDVPHGKSVRYWLLFTERGADTTRRVRMSGTAPVYDTVRAGDGVTMTYWRHEIRSVTFHGATQDTWASPVDSWRLPVVLGLFLLPFGLGVLGSGLWYRSRYRSAAHLSPWQLSVGLVAGGALGCAGALAGAVGDGVGDAFALTAVGVPPAAGLAVLHAWWLARRAGRADDTSGIVPVPPAQKQCLRASVHGDVPYSVAGFDHLVVGDGRPAATPDPDGRVARKPLPGTLTVRGLRSLRPGDPEGWLKIYKHDCVVIECRDGEHLVRIGVARRDAPLVLGALATAPTTAPAAEPTAS